MATKVQFRRGTAAAWTAANPVLSEGELGLELDTDLMKIGDGATAWNALAYANRGLTWQLPVGFVFMSIVATNPAGLLGYGTWSAFGTGRMPIGVDPGISAYAAPEETGGATSATPAGSVTAPTFTGDSNATSAVSAGTPAGSNSAPAFTGSASQNTSAVSGGTPAGTNSAPAFTGGADVSTAVSAGTPAGTNSAPTFAGSALATHAHELPFQKTAGGTGQLGMLAPSIFGTGTSRARESVSAAPTASTTSAAVELSEAKSAGTPAGTVTAPVFTGSALGTHQHTTTATGTVAAPAFTGSALGTHQHTLTPAGTVTAPAFTGSALGTHSHSVTPTGTNSAPAFTGNSMSILPPFIAVYMFKRTA